MFVNEVLLDGVKIERCIEANEEGGYVVILLVEETDHGLMIKPGNLKLYGDVKIVWKDSMVGCEDDEGLLIRHRAELTCRACENLCTVCYASPGDCDCEPINDHD